MDFLLGLVALISALFSNLLFKNIAYLLSLFSLSKQYIDDTVHAQDTSKILTECMHAWFCMYICVRVYVCMYECTYRERGRQRAHSVGDLNWD